METGTSETFTALSIHSTPFTPSIRAIDPRHKTAPSVLLYNRVIRGKLPYLIRERRSKRHKQAQENDAAAKEKLKSYVDNKRQTNISDIKVSDTVL